MEAHKTTPTKYIPIIRGIGGSISGHGRIDSRLGSTLVKLFLCLPIEMTDSLTLRMVQRTSPFSWGSSSIAPPSSSSSSSSSSKRSSSENKMLSSRLSRLWIVVTLLVEVFLHPGYYLRFGTLRVDSQFCHTIS